MKSSVFLATMFALAGAAQAASVTVGYDYVQEVGTPKMSRQDLRVGTVFDTKYGSFDSAIIGTQARDNGAQDKALGFETGYSNGLQVGPGVLTARVSYGRLNQVDPNGAGWNANLGYYTIGAEYQAPIKGVQSFVGYRHLQSADTVGMANENRIQAGVYLPVTKNVDLKLNTSYTFAAGKNYSGVGAAVKVGF